MPQTLDTFGPVRARRQQAQHDAAQAAQAWLDTVGESIALFVAACDVAGPNAVVVFVGEAEPGDEGAARAGREVLRSVAVASEGGTRSVVPGADDLWLEAVDAWDHLRRAAELAFLAEIPVSMAVDLDNGVVMCWEPVFCVEDGPDPEMSFSLADRDAPSAGLDAFAALLAAADDEREAERRDTEWHDRVFGLLEVYGLSVPSSAFLDGDEWAENDVDEDGDSPFAA